MAKVPFTKLKCKINMDEIPVQIGEETIAVKQYLPIQDKLALIGRIVEYAHEEDANYSNPVKAAIIRDLEVVFSYTNINFTEKQKEDLAKLYDQLYCSQVIDTILQAIPETEYKKICIGVEQSIDSIYKYQNSVLGILDTLKTNYEEVQNGISDIAQNLITPENLDLVKGILTKLN